jgi:hypothetical protein
MRGSKKESPGGEAGAGAFKGDHKKESRDQGAPDPSDTIPHHKSGKARIA